MAVPAEQMGHDSEVLLSIVVPFYNSAHKSERLLSTLRQLSAQDVEVVLVDDGSNDATLQQFKNDASVAVLVLTQNNRGPGGARNTGLRSARGKYVLFVDSDDDIGLGAIAERFCNLFARNKCRQLVRRMRPNVGIVAAARAGDRTLGNDYRTTSSRSAAPNSSELAHGTSDAE